MAAKAALIDFDMPLGAGIAAALRPLVDTALDNQFRKISTGTALAIALLLYEVDDVSNLAINNTAAE